jgi:hypothetical protein
MNLPETQSMFSTHLWAVIGLAALVPVAFMLLALLMLEGTAVFRPRDARDSLLLLRTMAPWAVGATALIALFSGISDDHGLASKDFAAAAKTTYGVGVEADDASDVMVSVSDGKSSEPFNVDGYAHKVDAATRPNGDVTLRDAPTDKASPKR